MKQGLALKPSVRDSFESPYSKAIDPRSRSSSWHKYVLIGILLTAKLAYLAWYYTTGINLNLGDTATYLTPESAEIFYERSGGVSFGYVATLLFSAPATRIPIEMFTIGLMCWFILRMPTRGSALAATVVLLLPTSLAFMTVASKELLIFLPLILAYQARKWVAFPALIVTAVMKPSFALIALFPLLRRWGAVATYAIFSVLITAGLLFFEDLKERYTSAFYEFHTHFLTGNLSYEEPGLFPFAPIMRTIGLGSADQGSFAIVLSISMLVSTAFVAVVLTRKNGFFVGGGQYLVFLAAALPYSMYNLGSAARYQAPLICCIILNELLGGRWNYAHSSGASGR